MATDAYSSESVYDTHGFRGFTFNPEAKSHTFSASSRHVTIQAKPLTDWWRVPPPTKIESRTGAFLARTVEATRDFEAGVWLRGEWDTQFDQGTLMILTSDSKDVAGNWVKTGVELEGGKEYVGAVVTSPWSDWTISPVDHSTSTSTSKDAYWIYMSIKREGPLLTIKQAYAQQPTEKPPQGTMIREVRGFNVDGSGNPLSKEGDKWRVGVMICGPKNEEGTVGELEDFSFVYL